MDDRTVGAIILHVEGHILEPILIKMDPIFEAPPMLPDLQ